MLKFTSTQKEALDWQRLPALFQFYPVAPRKWHHLNIATLIVATIITTGSIWDIAMTKLRLSETV